MKTYSDSYLMSKKKTELIELIRCAEHNERAAEATLAQHIENVKDWRPVPKGHWMEVYTTRDGTIVCQCSECGNVVTYAAGHAHKYCHECGAFMQKGSEQDAE